jgi:precorrin-2/cobalt-factor-2 C20-methyltransferase
MSGAAGTLYGVGVGPGDPELLTLKAARIVRDAPVVAYPAPLEGESLARTIAAPHIDSGKTEIAIRLPFTPEREDTEARYDAAAATLAGHLAAGRDVALLCLGDPLLYGTFAHVMTRIAGRFTISVVPGVNSLAAAAAATAQPLAMKDESFAVVPATLPESALTARLSATDSAAIVKLGRHLAKIRRVIEALGLLPAARYVEFAATGAERVRPLAEVSESESAYFAVVLLRKRDFP